MIRCESKLSKDFLRTVKEEGERNCKRKALFKIDNKCLCANHASLILLRRAVAENAIEKIKA